MARAMVLQFNLSILQDPVLTFSSHRTGTGFQSNQVAYSTDGTSYTDFGSPYSPVNGSFGLLTFDFSAINVLDGASTAFIKITFSGGTNSSGNNRIDNIQLNAVPEAPAALLGVAVCGMVGLVYGGKKLVGKKA